MGSDNGPTWRLPSRHRNRYKSFDRDSRGGPQNGLQLSVARRRGASLSARVSRVALPDRYIVERARAPLRFDAVDDSPRKTRSHLD